ncbi:protein HESO1-like isoform X2 [Carya illinoinensis]|uniref:protein HESO1-like isoform X2 n=1 Tax=Carya illinoinensis TaxID=32201 RepID=UPI001C7275CC|nr:protein HESO1-like isoform X2 [Carya illinoinensis]
MALSGKVLQKKAKKLELRGLQKNKINPTHLSDLDELLNDIFVSCLPKLIDYDHRRDLVRIFNAIAKEIYGNSDESPVVEAFGSFVMDIFCAGSDIDLSVNFSNMAVEISRQKRIETLKKFAKKFQTLQRGGHVACLQTITTARVPVVKVIDCGTGIECDLSVENRDGIAKSQIVHMVSMIDERFRKLSFLVKAWAKAHSINSSKDRTLNSLSLVSLVAFHLQTRDPPILPPFSALFKDGTDPGSVARNVHNYLDYGKKNKESLAELFITLLIKVEDFSERSQNVARAVGGQEVKKIYERVQYSLGCLLTFLGGRLQQPTLRDILFGDAVSTLPDVCTRNPMDGENTASPVPSNPRPMKKQRIMEGQKGQQFVEGSGRKQNYDASRLGNNLCHSAGTLPSDIQGSDGHLQNQPIIYPQTSPWFGAPHSQDPIFLNQYPGQFNSFSLQDLIISGLLLGSFYP